MSDTASQALLPATRYEAIRRLFPDVNLPPWDEADSSNDLRFLLEHADAHPVTVFDAPSAHNLTHTKEVSAAGLGNLATLVRLLNGGTYRTELDITPVLDDNDQVTALEAHIIQLPRK